MTAASALLDCSAVNLFDDDDDSSPLEGDAYSRAGETREVRHLDQNAPKSLDVRKILVEKTDENFGESQEKKKYEENGFPSNSCDIVSPPSAALFSLSGFSVTCAGNRYGFKFFRDALVETASDDRSNIRGRWWTLGRVVYVQRLHFQVVCRCCGVPPRRCGSAAAIPAGADLNQTEIAESLTPERFEVRGGGTVLVEDGTCSSPASLPDIRLVQSLLRLPAARWRRLSALFLKTASATSFHGKQLNKPSLSEADWEGGEEEEGGISTNCLRIIRSAILDAENLHPCRVIAYRRDGEARGKQQQQKQGSWTSVVCEEFENVDWRRFDASVS